MSLACIEGHRGSGKTLYATRIASDAISRGVDVFANYELNFDSYLPIWQKDKKITKLGRAFLWTDFNDIKDYAGCLIIIDEAYLYLDARRWTDFPDWFKLKLALNRHERLQGVDTDILVVTQDIKQIDIAFRRLTYKVIKIIKYANIVSLVKTYDYDEVGLDETLAKRKLKGLSLVWHTNKLYNSYDSWKLIDKHYDINSALSVRPVWSAPDLPLSQSIA